MSRIVFWLALIFLVFFAGPQKIRCAQKRNEQQFRQALRNQEVARPGRRCGRVPRAAPKNDGAPQSGV